MSIDSPRPEQGSRDRLRAASLDLARGAGSLRLPELLLFAALVCEGSFGLPLPLNQVVLIAIILLGAMRRQPIDPARFRLLVPVLALALFYIGVVSMFADPSEFASDWHRRLLRLSLTAIVVLVIGAGRLDLRSSIAGLCTGLVGNAVAFYVGLAPDYYGGVLSGFFEDKNVAGLAYAVFGVLLVGMAQRRRSRIILILGFGMLVWLTASRTSISAYLAGLAWILIAPRLRVLGRWVLGAVIYLGVNLASEDFSRIGTFSDREGSDLLRSRIDAASEIKVGDAGLLGDGLGEAYVVFDDEPGKTWFFHNSYWSALVEGGWPWLLLILGITVVVGLRPFTQVLDSREIALQAATVALLICAWRLGEVLFTLQWGVVMGMAILVRAQHTEHAEPCRHPGPRDVAP